MAKVSIRPRLEKRYAKLTEAGASELFKTGIPHDLRYKMETVNKVIDLPNSYITKVDLMARIATIICGSDIIEAKIPNLYI